VGTAGAVEMKVGECIHQLMIHMAGFELIDYLVVSAAVVVEDVWETWIAGGWKR
jgi:hypothetical protein